MITSKYIYENRFKNQWFKGIDFVAEKTQFLNALDDSKKETDIQAYIKDNNKWFIEYYGAAEPPVRCGESHQSGQTEPPYFALLCSCLI